MLAGQPRSVHDGSIAPGGYFAPATTVNPMVSTSFTSGMAWANIAAPIALHNTATDNTDRTRLQALLESRMTR